MKEILFLGDEQTACAWHLAGITTRVVTPEETHSVMESLTPEEILLLLVSSINAASLPPQYLNEKIRQGNPLVMVVEDVGGKTKLPDFVTPLRRRLGVAL